MDGFNSLGERQRFLSDREILSIGVVLSMSKQFIFMTEDPTYLIFANAEMLGYLG